LCQGDLSPRRELAPDKRLEHAHARFARVEAGQHRVVLTAGFGKLLAPADRPAIYVGKLVAIVAMMLAVQVVLVPLVALLFQAGLLAAPLLLGGILLAGTLGFAAVGTLFAAMLVRARSRDVLLPVLLYPITIPVIIGGVRGTVALVGEPPDLAMAQFWTALLLFFDVVFVTLSLWTFEPLMTE